MVAVNYPDGDTWQHTCFWTNVPMDKKLDCGIHIGQLVVKNIGEELESLNQRREELERLSERMEELKQVVNRGVNT